MPEVEFACTQDWNEYHMFATGDKKMSLKDILLVLTSLRFFLTLYFREQLRQR
jgi:hypothetical protein